MGETNGEQTDSSGCKKLTYIRNCEKDRRGLLAQHTVTALIIHSSESTGKGMANYADYLYPAPGSMTCCDAISKKNASSPIHPTSQGYVADGVFRFASPKNDIIIMSCPPTIDKLLFPQRILTPPFIVLDSSLVCFNIPQRE